MEAPESLVLDPPMTFSRDEAVRLFHLLNRELGTDDLGVVGQVRRGLRSVNGLDIVLPEAPSAVVDPFSTRLARLWGAKDGPIAEFVPSEGFRAGFRRASFLLRETADSPALRVTFHRYVPGPEGNAGWIMLLNTGPDTFVRRVCNQWRKVSHGGRSSGGFLHFADGTKFSTPTEADVFRGLLWPVIHPQARR